MALLKQTWAVMAVLSWGSAAIAGSCPLPAPPWMPADPVAARRYEEILMRDVDEYFASVESYFRCVDDQRRQVFEEARQFSDDFSKIFNSLRNNQ
jgi:hypothetical protein